MRRQLLTESQEILDEALEDEQREYSFDLLDIEFSATDEKFLKAFQENDYNLEIAHFGYSVTDLILEHHGNSIIEKILKLPNLTSADHTKLLAKAVTASNIPCIELILNNQTNQQIDDSIIEEFICYTAATCDKQSFVKIIAHYKEKHPELAHYKLTLAMLRHKQEKFLLENWNLWLKNIPDEDQELKQDISKISSLFTRLFASERVQKTLPARIKKAVIKLDQNEILSPTLLFTYAEEAKQQKHAMACLTLMSYFHKAKIGIDIDELFPFENNLWNEMKRKAEKCFSPQKKTLYELLQNSTNFLSLKESYLNIKETWPDDKANSILNGQFELILFNHIKITQNLQITLPNTIKIAGQKFSQKEISSLCLYHNTLQYLYNLPPRLEPEEQAKETFSTRTNQIANETQLKYLNNSSSNLQQEEQSEETFSAKINQGTNETRLICL